MTKGKTPKFGGGIFCTSTSPGEDGKTNCSNVFTSFYAWALPTSTRHWFAVLTLYDLPNEATTVNAKISSGRSRKKTELATGTIEKIGNRNPDIGALVVLPLRYRFEKPGVHWVQFEIEGTSIVKKIPLSVSLQAWPAFTKRQLADLRSSPSLPHSVRMNVVCSSCSRPYVFEHSVLTDEILSEGVMPFPQSGLYECESCGHRMQLKDLEGQVRNSIKNGLVGSKRSK